mmetsp:Transcript_15084/g.37066  ORF Transcript_15084/g.37066 Transcript_15084/m.37066 type:complete len:153 (-) Transcript_15084:636-1094(-)
MLTCGFAGSFYQGEFSSTHTRRNHTTFYECHASNIQGICIIERRRVLVAYVRVGDTRRHHMVGGGGGFMAPLAHRPVRPLCNKLLILSRPSSVRVHLLPLLSRFETWVAGADVCPTQRLASWYLSQHCPRLNSPAAGAKHSSCAQNTQMLHA